MRVRASWTRLVVVSLAVVVWGGAGCGTPDEAVDETSEALTAEVSAAAKPVKTAVLTLSPGSRDYGTLAIGVQSGAVTFTVTNGGSGASTALSTALTGANPGSFVITNDQCNGRTLNKGKSCTIAVAFRPQAAGALSASLGVSATNASSAGAALSGSGAGAPQLALTPASAGLGAATPGSTGGAVTVTVKNGGTVATTPLTVSLAGTNPTSFALTSNGCGGVSLAPAGSCTVTVALRPQAVGPLSALLQVGASNSPTAAASLTGTGLGVPALAVAPSGRDYGSQTVGTTSSAASFTVSNPGSGPTASLSVILAGANAADFVVTSNSCAGPLAPGGTCTVAVAFAPTATGARSASLTVSGGGLATSVALTGTGAGVASTLVIAPGSRDFGNAIVGAAGASYPFTVTNTGAAGTQPIDVTLEGANAGDFQLAFPDTCLQAFLSAGATCTLFVTFQPQAAGSRAATLKVAASGSGAATASLVGTGLIGQENPNVKLVERAFSFGARNLGDVPSDEPHYFTVLNTGAGAVSLGAVSLTGETPGEFKAALSSACGGTLAPGASCELRADFVPTSGGRKSALFTVDTSAGPVVGTLTGVVWRATLRLTPNAPHDFGMVAAGSSSAPVTYTMTNTGEATTSSPVDVALSSAFALISNGCGGAFLPRWFTCDITIAFTPAASGSYDGLLIVKESDLDITPNLTYIGSTDSVAVSGTAP